MAMLISRDAGDPRLDRPRTSLLLDQLERLTAAVEQSAAKSPQDFRTSANAKLLTALHTLVFRQIPADPALPVYRQGDTLGKNRKYWLRAKFGKGRFRLFFRYSLARKIIIFALVNDSESLRTRGAKTDAYYVFHAMINNGNPPDGWDELEKAVQVRQALARLVPAITRL